MGVIDELKRLLTIKADADSSLIEQRFEEISTLLLNHCCIKRGSKVFYIEEIEFYFYNSNHRDLITYPRSTKALQWYLNAFGGIDLTFDSHVTTQNDGKKETFSLDERSAFGGILLRKFSYENENINYPMNCAYKMFDILDAVSRPEDYPILIECEDRRKPIRTKARTNIITKNDTVETKVKKILRNNSIINELTDKMLVDFGEFIKKEYKYYTE